MVVNLEGRVHARAKPCTCHNSIENSKYTNAHKQIPIQWFHMVTKRAQRKLGTENILTWHRKDKDGACTYNVSHNHRHYCPKMASVSSLGLHFTAKLNLEKSLETSFLIGWVGGLPAASCLADLLAGWLAGCGGWGWG